MEQEAMSVFCRHGLLDNCGECEAEKDEDAPPPLQATVVCSSAETVWGFADSDDTERWHGSYKSRQEAIDAGRDHYRGQVDVGQADTFWIAMGRRPSPAEFLPDVDWLLEEMTNAADGAAGEASEEFPDVSDAARKEFGDLLEAWAEKNIVVSFWIADGHTEEIPLEEEEETDG